MKQASRYPGLTLTALLLASALLAHAQTDAADPAQLIAASTDRVLELLAETDSKPSGDEAADELTAELTAVLAPVVDSPAIARAVMGRHRSAATQSQQEEFAKVFRDSLISLYTRTFQAFEVEEAQVKPLGPDFDATSDRASIAMRVSTANDSTYDLSYSMRRNGAENWMVRNIIVDGINLGLTYLNQFDGAMTRYGSIDAVIDRWADEMREQDAPSG